MIIYLDNKEHTDGPLTTDTVMVCFNGTVKFGKCPKLALDSKQKAN